ncbi:MAG: nuclear transport factor 2 family protein [Cyanobacteria bacterium J06639_1]
MTRLSFALARHCGAIAGSLTLLTLLGVTTRPAIAQSSEIPDELQDAVSEAVERANQGDLKGVMNLYSSNFRHDDGLDIEQTRAAIARLWDTHDTLEYEATIESWERQGDAIEAIVQTGLTGTQSSERGDFQLEGLSTVRNRYIPSPSSGELLLVAQEVLSESTTLTSGDRPPQFDLNLPAYVAMGAEYDLEAIVTEPLGDRVLLGAVIDNAADLESYQTDIPFPLQPLQAGGLFRRADAPFKPSSEWISVMLIGDGGITIEGRRLNVVRRDEVPQ